MGVPKSPRLKISQLCGTITSGADLWLGWGLDQSCSPCRVVSYGVLHPTCTQGNWVDSRLPVVRSQTTNLTPSLFFSHILCCRCPNGSCEPILDIYVSIVFQWYKELFKARGFEPCNCSLKFRESTETPTPKHNGSSFGSVSVHSHTLPHFGASPLACTLANPCLGHKPKARVATKYVCLIYF
jgi:hypothetical protein